MAKLLDIGVFPEKKAPKQMIQLATLIAGGGIEGDFHAFDGGRSISLMGVETAEEIREKGLAGFCTSKFSANLTTEGLDYHALHEGDRLAIGNAIIHIEQVGKECFADCYIEDRAACPMRMACAFGAAEDGGIIESGAEITVVGQR